MPKFSDTATERHARAARPERIPQTSNQSADAEILALVVECFETLSDPTRVRALYALIEGPLCVSELAEVAGVSHSAMSHQLKLLKTRGLVKPRRDRNTVYYSLDDHHIALLFREAEFHADHRRQGRPDHD